MSIPNLLNLSVFRLAEEAGILEENDEKGLADSANPLILLVRPARFELATYGFVDEVELVNLLKSLES